MQVICSYCHTKLVLDDRQIAQHTRVKYRCNVCKQASEFDVVQDPNRTQASRVRAESAVYVEPTVVTEQLGLRLPPDKRLYLHVAESPNKYEDFELLKPRVILGRLSADFVLEDPEISRWHCVLEVRGEDVRLRDLDSRNGTWVHGERIIDAELRDNSEFRVGNTVLRLRIAPR